MHAAPASLRAELLTRAVTLSNIIDRSSLRWAAKEALPKLCVLLQNSLQPDAEPVSAWEEIFDEVRRSVFGAELKAV